MVIPVIVLAIVFLLIAIRQVGGYTLRIWQIMLGGALAVLLLGQSLRGSQWSWASTISSWGCGTAWRKMGS